MVVAAQPIPLDKKGALKHLEKINPETLALANDWEDIAAKVIYTQEKIKECVMGIVLVSPLTLVCRLSSTEPDSQTLGMVHLHNRTSFKFLCR
jgi:U3 small nucleolar RNA-associated protein 3